MNSYRSLKGGLAAAAVVVVSGCAVQAPPYSVSIENVDTLKKSAVQPAKLGAFTVRTGAVGGSSIQLRANSMGSPVGSDYAAYLAEAVRQELDLAKRLDPSASYEISGEILKNDIDTAIGTASGVIEARFVVKNNGQVRFDKVKQGDFKWDSSFAAAIAIPKAQQAYPFLVQRLLGALYSDADFQNALK